MFPNRRTKRPYLIAGRNNGTVNATNLNKAHALIESHRRREKLVVTGL
jgi:hypothetical protein